MGIVTGILILSVLLSHWWHPVKVSTKKSLRSFTAGFTTTYIFLILLPELTELGRITGLNHYLMLLVGFATLHILLSLVNHLRSRKQSQHWEAELHLVVNTLYTGLIAFSISELLYIDVPKSIILSIFVGLHMSLSDVSLANTNNVKILRSHTWVLIGAILVGTGLAVTGLINIVHSTLFFGVMLGAVMYISLREEILTDPHKTRSVFYLAGLLLGLLAIYDL